MLGIDGRKLQRYYDTWVPMELEGWGGDIKSEGRNSFRGVLLLSSSGDCRGLSSWHTASPVLVKATGRSVSG